MDNNSTLPSLPQHPFHRDCVSTHDSWRNPTFTVGTAPVHRDAGRAFWFGSRHLCVVERVSTLVVGSYCPNGLLACSETCPVCGAAIGTALTRPG